MGDRSMANNYIKIGSFYVGPEYPAFLVAEAGVNHDGDMDKAKELIEAAKTSKADAIKFQSFVAERVIRRDAPKAKFQDRNIGTEISQFDMLKRLDLAKKQVRMLKDYAESIGILFISTAYDTIAV